MAIVVEDGTGKNDAQTYASVAEADTYHATHGDPSAWSSATTANKEFALINATEYLEWVFGHRWRGLRSNELQALDWPRTGIVDDDGYAIDATDMPQRLKDACMYLALQALSETLLVDVSGADASISREKVKLGDLEQDRSYAGVKSVQKRYSRVEKMLRHYTVASNRVLRG